MRLGTFFADVLADLEFAQPVNHQGANDQSGKHCGQTGKRSAESEIPENAERRKIMKQFRIQQPVEQSASGSFLVGPRSSVLGRRSSIVDRARSLSSPVLTLPTTDDRRPATVPSSVPSPSPTSPLATP